MNFDTKITQLFNIQYPIIQGGMVWVSGANLASEVSNCGGLGVIGAGSMKPELLKEQIKKAKIKTNKPFGVNVPLLYELAFAQLETALDEGVKIFFTSAGNPNKHTSFLKKNGATVVHVISSPLQAKKCEDAGVDAVVAEGFEAGGHNGKEELTSFILIPKVKEAVNIPVIAAGGIYDFKTLYASLILGASGVQMGTRFLMTEESSAHQNFKDYLLKEKNHLNTKLCMKETTPVRLFQNKFMEEVLEIEKNLCGENLKIKLLEHLGKNRAKNGMHLGDVVNGELEIGQVITLINEIKTVKEVFQEIINESLLY